MKKGFARVRPLEGGLDAWAEAGFEIEGDLIPLSPTGTFRPVA